MSCPVCGLDACGLASHKQLAKAIAEAAEGYGSMAKADSVIDQAMEQVRLAKAQEAREDLEMIAEVVRQRHPELTKAQVITKALEAHPELYEDMVS
jgi:hypothetical protein